MRVAFFGTSEFVGAVRKARFLRQLVAAGIRPAVVVTAPDPVRPGKDAPAVRAAAAEFGIPVLQPGSLQNFAEELAGYGIELSLVAAYGKILPADVLAVPAQGSLNIHPSLLPRWRGPTPVQAAILAGDSVTGVSVIKMDEEMDHGPIIAQREFELGSRSWTAPELSDALTDLGVELVRDILEPWRAGTIAPQPQDHARATYSRLLRREDGQVDWSRPAVEIERMVRAFQPWPGAYTFWKRNGNALRLSVEAAEVRQADANSAAVGEVSAADGQPAVRTGDGMFVIVRLKPEGGASMGGEQFLRGHPSIIGSILL